MQLEVQSQQINNNMKEIKPKIKDDIELNVKKQNEKEYTFIGNLIPHEGHTIWEINNETLEINKAKFISSTYYMFGDNKKEISVKQKCSYVSALNEKNALIKYKKGVNGGKVLGNEKFNW